MAKPVDDRPREDLGFFGPGSPTWRVWTHSSSFVGFQRAVTIQSLDPDLSTAVAHAGGVYDRPADRFDRTAHYFLTVAIGDGRAAVEASEWLFRRHAPMTGIEPLRGTTYAANDPDSQLWIHVTAWHSMLCCYERFGPGRLSAADEERYWQESAVAAQLQTVRAEDVPRSRDEVRAYFERMRPVLCLGTDGARLFQHLLRPAIRRDAIAHSVMWRFTGWATAATMPRWMRIMAGQRPSRVRDAVSIIWTRMVVALAQPGPIQRFALRRLAPRAHAVLVRATTQPVLRNETVTIEEVRATLGLDPVLGHGAPALAPVAD
ncbi:MAG: hypothetical protein JWL76_269 [Thermoleophilia bacterium]|nr:hypothetical protein [Thermoleophilia bacterium]